MTWLTWLRKRDGLMEHGQAAGAAKLPHEDLAPASGIHHPPTPVQDFMQAVCLFATAWKAMDPRAMQLHCTIIAKTNYIACALALFRGDGQGWHSPYTTVDTTILGNNHPHLHHLLASIQTLALALPGNAVVEMWNGATAYMDLHSAQVLDLRPAPLWGAGHRLDIDELHEMVIKALDREEAEKAPPGMPVGPTAGTHPGTPPVVGAEDTFWKEEDIDLPTHPYRPTNLDGIWRILPSSLSAHLVVGLVRNMLPDADVRGPLLLDTELYPHHTFLTNPDIAGPPHCPLLLRVEQGCLAIVYDQRQVGIPPEILGTYALKRIGDV